MSRWRTPRCNTSRPRRRRRPAEDVALAGTDPAQPVFRLRHQGPDRLAHLLRAPGRLGQGRQPDPLPAAEVPSKANGGLSADGLSVTWKIKQGVKWHDGKPLTADDVAFTYEYAKDPATAAYTTGSYKDIKVEKVDSHTVKVIFQQPTPFWADLVGTVGQILPKHRFGDYVGAKSREAPDNLKPVGTGP